MFPPATLSFLCNFILLGGMSELELASGVRFLPSLRRTIDLLIYLSVAMGVVLLLELFGLVPTWLFFSVFVGWLAYLIVAVFVARRRPIAYPAALVLAVLTLAVSLPQPEHYAFIEAGATLAASTFIIGSVVQILLLILIPIYLYQKKSGKP